MSFLICHYVILSYKNHQFISVTLLFCLQINICLSQSLCYSVFKKNICLLPSLCYSVFKKTSVSLRPHVILSSKKHLSPSVTLLFCLPKKHLSPFVIMSFCLTKITSFSPSLCYSVFKKTSVSLCHYVIMSSKKHLSLSVPLLFCLKTPQLGTEAGPSVVVVISFLSVLYQYFISSATSSPTTFLQYILFDKVVEITSCGILRTVSYLVPLRGSKLSFKTIEEHVKHLSLSVV